MKIKFSLRCGDITADGFVLDTDKKQFAIGDYETKLEIFNIEIEED